MPSIDTPIVTFGAVIPRVEDPSSHLIFVQPNECKEILAESLPHDWWPVDRLISGRSA
jgi:hypothetical protein